MTKPLMPELTEPDVIRDAFEYEARKTGSTDEALRRNGLRYVWPATYAAWTQFTMGWKRALLHTRSDKAGGVAKRIVCACDCDGGVDWQSGCAEVCRQCEGAGEYSIPNPATLPAAPDKLREALERIKMLSEPNKDIEDEAVTCCEMIYEIAGDALRLSEPLVKMGDV